jgi:EAL domain-containing protein (putative c-di-GMP-specific phosphodiesterase class I)
VAEDRDAARESERLDALRAYKVLDTPPEDAFDEIVRLAAAILGAPTAMVSLVDNQRQWFKAKTGCVSDQTSRDVAFCAHAIQSNDVLVVPDATRDPRFADNPLVTGDPKIRFYAGAPLVTTDGHALGTLCVIDYVPRELSAEQRHALLAMSRHVTAQLELRRRLMEFAQSGAQRAQNIAPLQLALERNEFQLYYQPKVSLRTGRIIGVEALIRWHSPESGLVSPAHFIPLLEESGLIVPVGTWALAQARSDYRELVAEGLPSPRIAVNVSPLQVRDPAFVQHAGRILGAAEGNGVDIEITEGLLLDQTDDCIRKLHAVREMGAKIAIDDFGTGYSSLRYLTQLPIDYLKIDRSFITAMNASAGQFALVSSVITLAHGLNLKVTAEGVETDKQRRMLALMRCDEMQGFLHSRPMPKEDLKALLRAEAAQPVSESRFVSDQGTGLEHRPAGRKGQL